MVQQIKKYQKKKITFTYIIFHPMQQKSITNHFLTEITKSKMATTIFNFNRNVRQTHTHTHVEDWRRRSEIKEEKKTLYNNMA